MKQFARLYWIAILSVFPVLCSGQSATPTPRQPLADFTKLKDGDVVFIESSTSRAKLIEKLTGSSFSHCGLVFLDPDGTPRVYEGVGANSDIHQTINDWQKHESGADANTASGLHPVYARRLKEGFKDGQIETLRNEAAQLHHTPYDHAFQMGDPNDKQAGRKYIYCSELIYRAFQAIDVELGTPRTFQYYLDRASQKDRQAMNQTLAAANDLRTPPGPYKSNEAVISPEDIYVSALLKDVD